MINLCDKNKYYKDLQTQQSANRIPRTNEDIEIVGLINNNEFLNLTDLRNNCYITGISSLKISFGDPSYSLTIKENSTVTREKHNIGILESNAGINLNACYLINKELNSEFLILFDVIMSGSTINTNTIKTNSMSTNFLYSCNAKCSGININGFSWNGGKIESKEAIFNGTIENVKIDTGLLKLKESFVFGCKANFSTLDISGVYINGSFEYDESIQTQKKYPWSIISSSTIAPGTTINNIPYIRTNGVTIAGKLSTNHLNCFGGVVTIGGDGIVEAGRISTELGVNTGILNNGALIFHDSDRVPAFTLHNHGSVVFDYAGESEAYVCLSNYPDGSFRSNNGHLIKSNNSGFIDGSKVSLVESNNYGLIKASVCELLDNSINYSDIDYGIFFESSNADTGKVKNSQLYRRSYNSGNLDTCIMSGQCLNLGTINQAELYMESSNIGIINKCKLNFSYATEDSFSVELDAYGHSDVAGRVSDKINCYNSTYRSQYMFSGIANFYAGSKCFYAVGINPIQNPNSTGIFNFYDDSFFENDIFTNQHCILNFYDKSYTVTDLKMSGCQLKCFNNSRVTPVTNDSICYFYDHSRADGSIIGNAYGLFNNYSSFYGTIENGLFKDNSSNYGTILGTVTFANANTSHMGYSMANSSLMFYDSINYGNIGGNVVFSGSQSINSGFIYNSNSIKFIESSRNLNIISIDDYNQIIPPEIYFDNHAINSGRISILKRQTNIYFNNQSINFANIIAHKGTDLFFTNGSINYGTIISGNVIFDETSINYGTIIP